MTRGLAMFNVADTTTRTAGGTEAAPDISTNVASGVADNGNMTTAEVFDADSTLTTEPEDAAASNLSFVLSEDTLKEPPPFFAHNRSADNPPLIAMEEEPVAT